MKQLGEFPSDVGINPGRYGNHVGQTKLVCRQCRHEGFSHKDLKTYECEICGPLGYAKFDVPDMPCV